MSGPVLASVTWEPVPSQSLNERGWQAWLMKGRLRERRSRAARVNLMKVGAIAALLVAAGAWSQIAPWDVLVRFIVTAGALTAVAEQVRVRNYALAGLFGMLAIFYNPVAPALLFSGDLQRALVLSSVVPFLVSFAKRTRHMADEEGKQT